MQIGFIGLGKMGSRMVQKLVADGHEVVAWNRSQPPIDELLTEVSLLSSAYLQNITIAKSLPQLVELLSPVRVIWSMLPNGIPTQTVFDEVLPLLQNSDIFVDGGNAYFTDTEKRYNTAKSKGIRFLGIGVSGGIKAAENGFPLMAGGDGSAYKYIEPMLDTLAKPHGGHDYFGTGGAGHFVKMVHNGIEYGMMQAFGEGFGVLEKSGYNLDLVRVAKLWQKGTIISSFLLDCAAEQLELDPSLATFAGPIGENGEATWTIEEAKKEGVSVPVIADALTYRLDSQKDKNIQRSFVARVVSALRFAFGGHVVKSK